MGIKNYIVESKPKVGNTKPQVGIGKPNEMVEDNNTKPTVGGSGKPTVGGDGKPTVGGDVKGKETKPKVGGGDKEVEQKDKFPINSIELSNLFRDWLNDTQYSYASTNNIDRTITDKKKIAEESIKNAWAEFGEHYGFQSGAG